jgi:hypothetical protein
MNTSFCRHQRPDRLVLVLGTKWLIELASDMLLHCLRFALIFLGRSTTEWPEFPAQIPMVEEGNTVHVRFANIYNSVKSALTFILCQFPQ